MDATRDQYIKSHYIFPADQAKASSDRLSVDVVALYFTGGDSSGKDLPDFFFQSQRQSPGNGDDDLPRTLSARSPTSPDQLQNQVESGLPLPTSHRPNRKASNTDKKVNWFADGNGQLLRKAIQPLNVSRIIGVSIDLSRVSQLNSAQVAKDVGNVMRKLWQRHEGQPIVFLCHGYATFLLKDVMEPNEDNDLCPVIAAIGLFGVDPENSDFSELARWTLENGQKMSLQPLIFRDNHQADFREALDNLRRKYFVSVFAFRPQPPESSTKEGPKTKEQGSQVPKNPVLDRDPVWSGGDMDKIATFAGIDDARFRSMCRYIVESVEGHQLLSAARKNDWKMIEELIRRGANMGNINYTSRENKTALAMAAEEGHVETVRFLSTKDYVSLDHGVDTEKSALYRAVQAIKSLIAEVPESDTNRRLELMPLSTAQQILIRLRRGDWLQLDDEDMRDVRPLRETTTLDRLVRRLVRTMKVVETLLEAGALPNRGLLEKLDANEPLEDAVKQRLSNPPAVQGPLPRQLTISTPSEEALKVCRNTTFVVREVFSVGSSGKDRYIPVYTDINQVIYQMQSPIRSAQADGGSSLSSTAPSPTASVSGPIFTIQVDETSATPIEQDRNDLDSPRVIQSNPDKSFDIDDEFRRRREHSKETESQLLCRWYHIPTNNMAWVHDLFARLKIHVWPWPQGYRDHKPQSRAVYPQFVKPKPLVANTTESTPIVRAIMIPYLSYEQSLRTFSLPADVEFNPWLLLGHWTSRKSQMTRGDRWMNRLMRFSGTDISEFDFSHTYNRNQAEMYRRLEWAADELTFATQAWRLTNAYSNYKHDLGYKLPLHPRLTLDQSHYYMLRDTSYRDRTQVVSRWFRRNRRMLERQRETGRSFDRYDRASLDEHDHNILMVDQLWIWIIKDVNSDHSADATEGNVTLVTSFPDRVGVKSAAQDNIAQQVFRDNNRDSFRHVGDLVHQIISVCLRTLTEARVDGSVTFLQCFEISLGNLEERSGQSFLEFRRLSEFLEHLDENHPDYLSRRGLLLKMLLRISKDSRILSEVKDVLDEIGMIQSVLQDQSSALNDVDDDLENFLGGWENQWSLRNELRRTMRNFDQMKQRAQSVVDSIEKLLDLKQKHANLWEARTSREGSDVAAKAGNTLWWFTAVTIIFLPLSFMASFFALDIDKFPKDDDGDTNWPLNWVVGLLFGISMAFIIPLYTLAFFSENLQRTWSRIRGIWMPLIAIPILWALRMLPLLDIEFDDRSERIEDAVRKYDPNFEQIVEHMMGENGTEMIKDDDLDEEDDLIREWRRYYNNSERTKGRRYRWESEWMVMVLQWDQWGIPYVRLGFTFDC